MAYHSQIQMTANNCSDLLDKIVDFLTDVVGWTLLDDQRAGDGYAVLKTTGEDGKARFILKLRANPSYNRISAYQCLSWDATNHTGVRKIGQDGWTCIATQENAFTYWIYADLDHFCIVTHTNDYYIFYAGVYDTIYNKEYASTQTSIAAGSNVVVTVDDASMLQENEYYLLCGDENCERVKVTSISGNDVTLASVNNDYNAEARLGEDPLPNFVSVYWFEMGERAGLFLTLFDGSYKNDTRWTSWLQGVGWEVIDWMVELHKRYPNRKYIFPVAIGVTENQYNEFNGYLKKVYTLCSSKDNVVSEDTLEIDGITYDVFKKSDNDWAFIVPRG